MAGSYFVAESPATGVIGVLTESEVRDRLAAGALRPTFVCLPAEATGEVAGQWRPLAAVFEPPQSTSAASKPPTAVAGRWGRRPGPGAWLIGVGAVVVAGGLVVRVRARAWAWPDEWRYYGNRADTGWAYDEALYIDLGLAALALGVGLVLLGVWRTVR